MAKTKFLPLAHCPPVVPRRFEWLWPGLAIGLAIVVVATAGSGGRALAFSSDGIPVLGNGKHTRDSVEVKVLGTGKDGLDRPRDLAFNPDGEMELWIVNQLPPYRKSDKYPWVKPPEGAECSGPEKKERTDKEHWSSTTTYYKLGTDQQEVKPITDSWSTHFLAEASSIAFGSTHRPNKDGPSDIGGPGDPRSFATCGESRNEFKGCRPQQDFMGPALWSADPGFYGKSNETAKKHLAEWGCEEKFPDDAAKAKKCIENTKTDLGSHLDMLHESPNCMGVAWEGENVYWVFDGCGGSKWRRPRPKEGRGNDAVSASDDKDKLPPCSTQGDIVRYDFKKDHGPGFDDHCDGVIERYAEGVVKHVPGVPSHMQYDQTKKLLYIADTGNNRILMLDPKTRGEGRKWLHPLRENEGNYCTKYYLVDPQADPKVLVDGASLDCGDGDCMKRPSGLVLFGGLIFVTDNELGRVLAFDQEDGKLLDWLDLKSPKDPEVGPGSLMGIETDAEGNLYLVSATADELFRISPK